MADLAALIRDRSSRQAGRLHRHNVCLDFTLVQQRDELQELLAAAKREEVTRLAGDAASDVEEIEQQIGAIEEQMGESTVQIVFASLPYAKYHALRDEHTTRVVEENDTRTKELDHITFFPALVMACFVEFRQHGVKVPDLNEGHLSELLQTMPTGETDALYYAVNLLHMGSTDLPKSAIKFASIRGYGSSSKQRTGTE